jgi:hypothetical protein
MGLGESECTDASNEFVWIGWTLNGGEDAPLQHVGFIKTPGRDMAKVA